MTKKNVIRTQSKYNFIVSSLTLFVKGTKSYVGSKIKLRILF